MPTINSSATGFFDVGATWVGGVAPGINDIANIAGAHVVTIRTSRAFQKLTKTSTGNFAISMPAAAITLTGDLVGNVVAGAIATLIITSVSGSVTIVGNVTGDTFGAISKPSGACLLTITGTVTGGPVNGALSLSAGPIVVNGDIYSGTGGSSYGISLSGTATATINGNVYGAGSYGLNMIGSGTSATVNGNVTGGTGSGAYGAQVSSASWLTVTGSVTAGTGLNCHGVSAGTNAIIIIDIGGDITAIGGSHGVTATAAYEVRIAGRLTNDPVLHTQAVMAPRIEPRAGSPITLVMSDDATTPNLVTLSNLTGNSPMPEDVLAGVLYGVEDTAVGAYEPTTPGEVALGVPFGVGLVGEAVLTSAAVALAVGTGGESTVGSITAAITAGLADAVTDIVADITAALTAGQTVSGGDLAAVQTAVLASLSATGQQLNTNIDGTRVDLLASQTATRTGVVASVSTLIDAASIKTVLMEAALTGGMLNA